MTAQSLDLNLNLEVCTMRVCVKLVSLCPDLQFGTMLKLHANDNLLPFGLHDGVPAM